ncbi:MAG: SDR family NAD(P)-dependent oxidoreductase [Chloroflexi bacterium]|nr:SDR family NAD(P)-dependent oxidoreductase [Chloroflexota bacterium]
MRDIADPLALIDDLLEILVVPSFTRAGFAVRRRLFDWASAESSSMVGRTVVITGPTSGLGREVAGSFARMGARIVLVGRDAARLERTAAELRRRTPGVPIGTFVADMSSLASVRAATDRMLAGEPRIDVIVDNAGAMFADRQVTSEGFERTFATLVLGPFVLIARLLPRLVESPDARIVAVSSGGMYTQALPLDDLSFERGTYDGPRAYARAKRAQVALIREWARRLCHRGIVANAMHPGWANTPGLEASLPGFRDRVGGLLRTPAEGADTTVWLAAADQAREATGQVFLDRRPRPFDRVPSTRLSPSDRQRLWSLILAMTGEPDPTA